MQHVAEFLANQQCLVCVHLQETIREECAKLGMDRDGVEVHKLAKKHAPGQCPAILTEQSWPIKNSAFGDIFLAGHSG